MMPGTKAQFRSEFLKERRVLQKSSSTLSTLKNCYNRRKRTSSSTSMRDNKLRKKILLIFLVFGAFVALPAFAQQGYQLLAPLPGALGNNVQVSDFNAYLQTIFNVILGITIALSVIMIVIGG